MAPIKRKRAPEETTTQPEKKHKTKAEDSHSTTKLAVLPKEEPAFPRGGGSILTPLEQKQIQTQAVKDVLFEQSTGQKVTRDEFGDEENEVVKSASKTKRKVRSKDKKKKDLPSEQEHGVRMEGLSYKVCLTVH